MNAASIFTRTRLGMDTRVWAFLLGALIVSGALFGFRIATNQACKDLSIVTVNSDQPDAVIFYVNDQLSFTAKAEGKNEIEWDFGDNATAKGTRVVHSYTKTGTYFVTAIANGKCREFVSIIIRPQTGQRNHAAASGEPIINGPDAAKVGEQVNFYTNVNGQSYEWNVLNSPTYETQRIAVATYTFATVGPKTIELKVDGKILRKDIQILPSDLVAAQPMPVPEPLPGQNPEPLPEAAPAGPKAKIIPPEEFTDMLKKVTKGDMTAASFDQYLCEGGSASVRVLLNEDKWSDLASFCNKISKNKKYNIKNTQVIRDDNGCVKQLKISYCKWIVLGLKCKEE